MSAIEASTSIFVILESLDPSRGRFHWSLALFPAYISPTWSLVDLFQIVDDVVSVPRYNATSPNSIVARVVSPIISMPSERIWNLRHQASVDLLSPERASCIGAVRLPDATLSHSILKEFVEEQEPEQGETRTIRDVSWSCAQWLMRVLARLTESELYFLDMKHFYPKIQTLALRLERLHAQSPDEMHVLDFA